MNSTATPPRYLRVRRPLGLVLEQFLKPLSASLGHCSPVPPSTWGAGGGLEEGYCLRVLGECLGARTDLFAAVTVWFLALHGLALPSLRDLVDVMVHEYSGKTCIVSQTGLFRPSWGPVGSLSKPQRSVANQVIVGHRESVTLPGTPRLPWMSDKPCRTTAGITGSQQAVCRTGGHGVERPVDYSQGQQAGGSRVSR
jgi:hypothetical protein